MYKNDAFSLENILLANVEKAFKSEKHPDSQGMYLVWTRDEYPAIGVWDGSEWTVEGMETSGYVLGWSPIFAPKEGRP